MGLMDRRPARTPLHLRRRVRRDARALLAAIGRPSDLTFVRLWGNRGDELIWAGTRALMKGLSYREVAGDDLGDACGEAAVMSGCGGWCEKFHGLAPRVLPELEERFERVVVMPSTFDPQFEPVAEVLRGSRAVLFARDRRSQELLVDRGVDARVALDAAFFFDYRPYIRRGSGELVAMRSDAASQFRGKLPPDNDDISRSVPTMDQWLWTIAGSATVVTDRAHVMIAAAMLGKPVRWFPTDDHKLPGIAAYAFPDVRRVRSGKLTEAPFG